MPERYGYAWVKARKARMAIARANNEHCVRCGSPIDYSLSGRHRDGPTCDHLDPLALGGDMVPTPDLLAPAHLRCNSRHGQRLKGAKKSNVVPIDAKSESKSSPILSAPAASPRPQPSVVRSESSDPYSPPRILTPVPPDAAGTLAEEWVKWLEGTSGPGLKLRRWQRVVLDAALAVYSDGSLVFRDIVVSTPRQSGKGWLAYALAAMRCRFASDIGEVQTVLHVANNLAAARRIQSLAWRWAESNGLTVRRAMGQERVIWDDGSSWDICSVPAIWGSSSSIAIGDESWDLPVEAIVSALTPTLVERRQSQLWLTSTANEEATPLMPTYRRAAIEGAPRTFIAEWSAAPDADISDPAVWRAASPFWSPQREELMIAAQHTRSFRFQWLNMWPDIEEGRTVWLAGWDALPEATGSVLGGIGAVEVSHDRSSYGTAIALRRADDTFDVFTAAHSTLEDAAAWLARHEPLGVVAGQSIKNQLVLSCDVLGVGVRETGEATPLVAELVRNGRIRHDHGQAASEQIGWAAVTKTESGDMLSARKSLGPISTAKAIAWSCHAWISGKVVVEAPKIW